MIEILAGPHDWYVVVGGAFLLVSLVFGLIIGGYALFGSRHRGI